LPIAIQDRAAGIHSHRKRCGTRPDDEIPPDSAAVIQVLVPDKADTLRGRDIIMKISVEKDPER